MPLWGGGNDGIRGRWLGHLQPEQRGDVAVVEYLRRDGRCSRKRKILPGIGEQFIFIHAAQHEEKLRLFIEPGANAVERSRNVFAHVCPVRAAARQLDLLGRWKQTVALPADPVHDTLGQTALQEFNQGVDRSSAIPTDRLPARRLDGCNGDLDFVERRTGDHRYDLALRNLQVEDGAVADIGSAARHASRIVAITLKVGAPRLAPESFSDRAALDRHGGNGLPLSL